MVKVREFIEQFEKFAPLSLKMDGDPTGFQIGNKEAEIHKMMTTLDVRPEVVQEAIDNHVDFIFAHHPVMFRPAKNLDLSNPQNQMYANILKNDITVYAAHTNLDIANGGMNDWLAKALNLTNVTGLVKHDDDINGEAHYLGRVGEPQHPQTISDVVTLCKEAFNISGLRVSTFDLNQPVTKIAILGGSGSKFYSEALKLGANVFITGDLYYHSAQDMMAEGLNIIDPGHHIESICKEKLLDLFSQWNQNQNWNIDIMASQLSTDPFIFK
ncbi:Nif3-like dinuclear metal center hexameric protein [Fructilactobacillus vespulae]|uniref:Nif3-like dinuclear metal center hexameric protein n=1 Tax=Fructilactobacillus vespulae TaxID=1249630 RepID=UPI0039B42388